MLARCVAARLCVRQATARAAVRGVSSAAWEGNAETAALCKQLTACRSVDDVVNHYRTNERRYDVLNHVAAVNCLAVHDPQRKASGAALPHLVILEKFLLPVLDTFTARDIGGVLYLFSIYGHQVPAKLHKAISNHLVKQLSATSEGPRWRILHASGGRASTTRIDLHASCVSALHGPRHPVVPSQDAALAAWAFARQLIFSDQVFSSMAKEIQPWVELNVRPHCPATEVFTDDSLLRVAWAYARAGVADRQLLAALSKLFQTRTRRDGTDAITAAQPFTYEQCALLLWSFSVLGYVDESSQHLAAHVFDARQLELRRPAMPAALQQQLYQTHAFLQLRAPHLNVGELPAWLWQKELKAAAPKEADPYDSLYEEISKHLKELHLRHARQYGVDGFAIDIAFPQNRFGIEIVNKLQHRQGQAALAAAPPGTVLRGPHSKPPAQAVPLAGPSDPMDRNKLQYLEQKGWYVVQLDYARWRVSSKRERTEYLINLTREMDSGTRRHDAGDPAF